MTDLDLTPAPSEPVKNRRSLRNWIIMGVFVVAGIAILYQALTSARVFFLNVDEAVAQREELGDDVFRLQGTVVSEPDTEDAGELLFTVSFGGEDASIRHVGDEPSSLFKLGEQVVMVGHWEGQVFESDQILVKHSEEYVEDNPDRVDYELEDAELEDAELEDGELEDQPIEEQAGDASEAG